MTAICSRTTAATRAARWRLGLLTTPLRDRFGIPTRLEFYEVDELVDIVARLENGQSGLEESMGLWQRGEALAAHCATWLDRAEAKITAGD